MRNAIATVKAFVLSVQGFLPYFSVDDLTSSLYIVKLQVTTHGNLLS